jgi:uncharacterized protein (DUF2141 family)
MKKLFQFMFMACLLISLAAFQIIKTQLTITVRDGLGNTVEGATVRLFEKEDDYKNEENAAAEGTTDAKGKVKFKDLKAIPYYILAEKEDMNNFGGGEQTGKLEANRINQVNVVIQE